MSVKTKLAVISILAIALLAAVDPTLSNLATCIVAVLHDELNDDYIG